MNKLQERINFKGNLKDILVKVCQDFALGSYSSHQVIFLGYEDFNLSLTTDKGKFFVKIFSSFRNDGECKRYVDIIKKAIVAGISHPKLYESNQGFLHKISSDGTELRLCAMEYIDGKTFFTLNVKPTMEELKFLVKQTAIINNLNLKPNFVYDSWSIFNFLKEYKEKGSYLNKEDSEAIAPLVSYFETINIQELPHCFVHGDLIKTNLMKDKKGKIYIIDFAVANYYPRIQELAVLFNDIFFDGNDIKKSKEYYELALAEYQKYIPLTLFEIKTLPLFIKVGHAMHVLRANYEKIKNNNSTAENEYFLKLGKAGLQLSQKMWS